MINAIGLSGEGLEAFVGERLPRLLALPCPLILSVGGFSLAGVRRDWPTGLRDALEGSLGRAAGRRGWASSSTSPAPTCTPAACPSAATRGRPRRWSAAVRAVWPGLLVAKLTPNVTDITAIGRAAEAAGADALAAVNTYKGLVIDRHTLRPYLGNVTGGLSGPAIKPLALRAVYELFETVAVPIIGMGGVATVAGRSRLHGLRGPGGGGRVGGLPRAPARRPAGARAWRRTLADARPHAGRRSWGSAHRPVLNAATSGRAVCSKYAQNAKNRCCARKSRVYNGGCESVHRA